MSEPPPNARSRWNEAVVTGSAGRTSIATMVAALLQASGQHVGQIHASFVHSPLERLKVNGEPIAQESVRRLISGVDLDGPADRLEAVARAYFEEEGVTWVVRTAAPDRARNPALLVWAPVLPERDSSAANEAFRLSRQVPVTSIAASTLQRESVVDVLRDAYPGLREVAGLCALARGRSDLDGQELRVRTPKGEYRLQLPLLGRFQIENATTAILAVEQLDKMGVALTAENARTALAGLSLPARLEVVKRRPLVLVDAAETVAELQRLMQSMQQDLTLRRLRIILGATIRMDPTALIETILPLEPELLLTVPPLGEALDPSLLARLAYDAGLQARLARTIAEAVDDAIEDAGSDAALCITGSRETAGAARAHLLALMPAEPDLL